MLPRDWLGGRDHVAARGGTHGWPWVQNFHVRHRLERYRAGRRIDYASASPSDIATAIAQEIGRDVDYRPVATDGAARAASLLASLL